MSRITRKSHRVHTVYKNTKGDTIPGVTTICDLLSKPQLVVWANNLGLNGIQYYKYIITAANIGTLLHKMIEQNLRKHVINTDDYCKKDIEAANKCFRKFISFRSAHKVKPLLIEKQLISEEYQYGGTIDLFAEVDKIKTQVDFKTSDDIYIGMIIQLSAYHNLLCENGYIPEESRILRLSKNKHEGYEYRHITIIKEGFEIFKNLLKIYKVKRKTGFK